MSTRPQFGRYVNLATKTAQAASFNSSSLYKEDYPHYSIQVDVTAPAAFAATATLQGSVDGATYYDIGSAVNINAAGTLFTGTSGIRLLRVKVTVTGGNANLLITAHAIA